MLKEICIQLKTAFFALLIFMLLFGIFYPWTVTEVAQFLFPEEAGGSLIVKDDKIVGSRLMGQYFDDPKYFWGRPSATLPFPYNAEKSSGSNLGPTNPDLIRRIKSRILFLERNHPKSDKLIPIDLITASGSGLDPEITPKAAHYQARRIARRRKLKETIIHKLIEEKKQKRQFGFLGEPRINVLELNIELDRLTSSKKKSKR